MTDFEKKVLESLNNFQKELKGMRTDIVNIDCRLTSLEKKVDNIQEENKNEFLILK